MSVYQINKLCFRLKENDDGIAAYKRDPDAALSDYDLTEEERTAVRTLDVRKLYQWGVSPLLLRPFAMSQGMGRDEYHEAVQGLE